MLKKLLRHDMRTVGRAVAPLLLVVALSSAVVLMLTPLLNLNIPGAASTFISVTMTLFIIVNAICAILCPFLTLVLCAVSFYRSVFTDQGYLTLTLPVKRSSLLASKFIVTVIWCAISSVLSALALTAFGVEIGAVFFDDVAWLGTIIIGVFSIFARNRVYLLISLAVYMVSSTLFSIAAMFLAVAAGSTLVQKHRGIAIIGFYYIMSWLSSLVGNIVTFITMLYVKPTVDAFTTFQSVYSASVSAILNIGLGIAAYVLCFYFINNKLDLQ